MLPEEKTIFYTRLKHIYWGDITEQSTRQPLCFHILKIVLAYIKDEEAETQRNGSLMLEVLVYIILKVKENTLDKYVIASS